MNPRCFPLAAFLVLVFLEPLPSQAEPIRSEVEPGIVFSSSAWEFGTIGTDSGITYRLTVGNTGSDVYTITLLSTCGCLEVSPLTRKIGPGEESVFTLSFDPSAESGDIERYIIIRTTHPSLPRAFFTVRGKVSPGVTSPDRKL